MATLWRKPAMPLWIGPGTPVTAAALTSGLAGGVGGSELPALDPVDVLGTKLIIEAEGEITSTSATPTVTFGIYIGTVAQAIASKTLLAVSSAMAISASATAWPFHIRWMGSWRALGNGAAQLHGMAILDYWGNVGLTGAGAQNPMPITAAARVVSSLSSKQYNEVDLGITLSSVTGTPSVTITEFQASLEG